MAGLTGCLANQITAVLRSLGPVITELNADAATILRDLSVKAGVLIPASAQRPGQNPPEPFLHRTVAEYLVAYHLGSLPREEWLAVVAEHLWFDLDWRPVISLLGAAFVQQERPAEAVHLIRYLLGRNQDPLHTALFRAARVIAELPDHDIVPAELVGQLTERMIQLAGQRDRASLGQRVPRRSPDSPALASHRGAHHTAQSR